MIQEGNPIPNEYFMKWDFGILNTAQLTNGDVLSHGFYPPSSILVGFSMKQAIDVGVPPQLWNPPRINYSIVIPVLFHSYSLSTALIYHSLNISYKSMDLFTGKFTERP